MPLLWDDWWIARLVASGLTCACGSLFLLPVPSNRGCWLVVPSCSIMVHLFLHCYRYLSIISQWLQDIAGKKNKSLPCPQNIIGRGSLPCPTQPVASLTAPPRLCSVPEGWGNLVFGGVESSGKLHEIPKRWIFKKKIVGFSGDFLHWPK